MLKTYNSSKVPSLVLILVCIKAGFCFGQGWGRTRIWAHKLQTIRMWCGYWVTVSAYPWLHFLRQLSVFFIVMYFFFQAWWAALAYITPAVNCWTSGGRYVLLQWQPYIVVDLMIKEVVIANSKSPKTKKPLFSTKTVQLCLHTLNYVKLLHWHNFQL